MDSEELAYKIRKYTNKLRKADGNSADIYQKKLQYYHQINQFGGLVDINKNDDNDDNDYDNDDMIGQLDESFNNIFRKLEGGSNREMLNRLNNILLNNSKKVNDMLESGFDEGQEYLDSITKSQNEITEDIKKWVGNSSENMVKIKRPSIFLDPQEKQIGGGDFQNIKGHIFPKFDQLEIDYVSDVITMIGNLNKFINKNSSNKSVDMDNLSKSIDKISNKLESSFGANNGNDIIKSYYYRDSVNSVINNVKKNLSEYCSSTKEPTIGNIAKENLRRITEKFR